MSVEHWIFSKSERVVCACSRGLFFRMKGLLGRREPLPQGEGIWLNPCNSIHMFFMQFPIDVMFLSDRFEVVLLYENFKQWRVSPIVWKAKSVVEMRVGEIQRCGFKVGDILNPIPLSPAFSNH
jgi:uncharacterized membrane protein (UPF0127 family)